MLERLMALSLRNRLVVGLGVALIVGLGVYAVRTIPIDAFPDVTNIQVEIVSTAPGLSPLEIEQFVTYPIEMPCAGFPGLVADAIDHQVRAVGGHAGLSGRRRHLLCPSAGPRTAGRGGADAARGRRDGNGADRHGDGRDLPVHPRGRAAGRGAERGRHLTDLRTLQDWMVAPLLKSVPGVNEINSFGGYLKQFQVIVDPDKLLTYELSVERSPTRSGTTTRMSAATSSIAGLRAVHHPRRRPDPLRGRHRQHRPEGRRGTPVSSATSARSGSATPSARAPP